MIFYLMPVDRKLSFSSFGDLINELDQGPREGILKRNNTVHLGAEFVGHSYGVGFARFRIFATILMTSALYMGYLNLE